MKSFLKSLPETPTGNIRQTADNNARETFPSSLYQVSFLSKITK